MVEPTLQVVGHPNVFAVGDINDVQETKMGAFATMQGKLVAGSIASLITNKNAKLKKYKAHPPLMLVPIGKYGGASRLGPITLGNFVTSNIKGKGVFLSMSWGLMNQKKNIPK